MSIVAMKRKALQKPLSSGGSFSLNGGYRNVGAVGQTNLIRSAKKCSTNDHDYIKGSTKNTLGYHYSTFKYPTCGQGGACQQSIWVKDFSQDNSSQELYIKKKVNDTMACMVGNKEEARCNAISCPSAVHIGGRLVSRNLYTKELYKNVSAEEYMRGDLMKKNCLPTPANRQHFPVSLNHNGCDINVKTVEEAIKAGLLPADYKY